jgi:hypothetical protein
VLVVKSSSIQVQEKEKHMNTAALQNTESSAPLPFNLFHRARIVRSIPEPPPWMSHWLTPELHKEGPTVFTPVALAFHRDQIGKVGKSCPTGLDIYRSLLPDQIHHCISLADLGLLHNFGELIPQRWYDRRLKIFAWKSAGQRRDDGATLVPCLDCDFSTGRSYQYLRDDQISWHIVAGPWDKYRAIGQHYPQL